MKQKIINTSIELFDEVGFTGTSIQEIVDNVGVTKGTFYYYFSSKQALLGEIHNTYIKYLLKQQEEIIADASTDCKTKLQLIIYLLLNTIEERGRSARIFFREMRNLDSAYWKLNIEKRDQFRKNCQTIVEEGMRAGTFRESLNPDMITRGILGVTNWSYYWFNPKGEVTDKKLTEIYLDMILNGINRSE